MMTTMARSPKAIILTETAAPGKIVAVNAAWNALCGYPPDEALGKTPSILQGPATSLRKAKQYARDVLAPSRPVYGDNEGFAARNHSASTTKLVNYTKSGEAFVHCLRTTRVMDEDTGAEYFLTESHEETDPTVSRAMLCGLSQERADKLCTPVKWRQMESSLLLAGSVLLCIASTLAASVLLQPLALPMSVAAGSLEGLA